MTSCTSSRIEENNSRKLARRDSSTDPTAKRIQLEFVRRYCRQRRTPGRTIEPMFDFSRGRCQLRSSVSSYQSFISDNSTVSKDVVPDENSNVRPKFLHDRHDALNVSEERNIEMKRRARRAFLSLTERIVLRASFSSSNTSDRRS